MIKITIKNEETSNIQSCLMQTVADTLGRRAGAFEQEQTEETEQTKCIYL